MSESTHIKNCTISPTGAHEYVTSTALGEGCKHCGLLRSTIEAVTKQEPEPSGLVVSPLSDEIIRGMRMSQAMRMGDEMARKVLTDKPNVPNHIFQEILKATGAKATIVITFDDPIMANPFTVHGFHVSAVNVVFQNIQSVLRIVVDAIGGRLGGTMNFRHGEEPPQATGV